MNRVYSLSGRRSVRRRRHPFFFLLLVLLSLLLIFNFQLYPTLSTVASAKARNEASTLIATAFSVGLAEEELSYDRLIDIRYRTDGIVSSMSCNMPLLGSLRNRLLLAVLEGLQSSDTATVRLPLGTLLGGDAFSGQGPFIEVGVLLARGATAYMESEFREVGINQSLHRILFTVEIDLVIMLPSRPLTLHVRESYPVAETVILGEVPDAYTEIDRLTDAVTEEDINDIYDFGAY